MLASLRGLQGFLELLVVSMLHVLDLIYSMICAVDILPIRSCAGANAQNNPICGTDFLDKKIYLIGVFAVMVALLSIVFNSFFTLVFIRNPTIRKTPIFYFGILAILDIFMAFNYIALMAVPVYMDQFELLWLYHIFLSYLRPVMAESCCAMFSSMLLIVLATTERLLRTINTSYCTTLRRFLERHRPFVCFLCIAFATAYKICVYFEIHYIRMENCTGFSAYEIQPTALAQNAIYKFWWMFLARNILDRILPFFVLVAMNFFIIRSLKQEQFRQLGSLHRGERSQSRMGRATLRDATRVLISCVSMYLMSQSLQVLITFWEAIHKSSLEVELYEFYSYLNDAMSIMTLLSSCLRYPVYCTCNKPIMTASWKTLQSLRAVMPRSGKNKSGDYEMVSKAAGELHICKNKSGDYETVSQTTAYTPTRDASHNETSSMHNTNESDMRVLHWTL
ncbi:hypothetical protein Tcan_03698 [Toxocara canis]|uniref:G-protein coupled receptors family 1 profile domain-containing protein n=2 Tax=Toxocara canis TaxID=6265 RepID=A0A0B2VJF8_TOXCA|nr:hypothetical protein Tcan_03698 [Toxocara canis]